MARSRSRSNTGVPTSDCNATNSLVLAQRKTSQPVADVEETDLAVVSDSSNSEPVSSRTSLEVQPSFQGGVSHLAGMRALEQLRKRLDTIDEHSREIRSARHILIKREQSLAKERDELVDTLNSIELAFLAGSSSSPDSRSLLALNRRDARELGGVADDDGQVEQSPKRKANADPLSDRPTTRKRSSESIQQETNGQRTSTSGPVPLTSLPTEPTLIEDCPPEFLRPSSSLPRPPENTPPSSFSGTPVQSPRSGGITRNGIRFPPGSAPRLPRSRSSSPFTQMLPPPVRASPVTPVPTKVYNPIVRCIELLEADFPTAAAKHANSPTRSVPILPALSTTTPENNEVYSRPPRPSKVHNGTIPIYFMLNDPSSKWDVAHMAPERTPSPPIGASHHAWNTRPRLGARRQYAEVEQSILDLQGAIGQAGTNGRAGDGQDGPASRTRARVSGAGFLNKGKGRV